MKLEFQTRIQNLKSRVEAERRARPGMQIRYSAACKQEAIALLDDGVTYTDLMRLVSIDANVMRKWQQKRAAVECDRHGRKRVGASPTSALEGGNE